MRKIMMFIGCLGVLMTASSKAADEWAESQMYLGVNAGIASYTNIVGSSTFSAGFDFGMFSASGIGIGGGATFLDKVGSTNLTNFHAEVAYQALKGPISIRLGARAGVLLASGTLGSSSNFFVGPVVGGSLNFNDLMRVGLSVGWSTTTSSPAVTRIDPRLELRYTL